MGLLPTFLPKNSNISIKMIITYIFLEECGPYAARVFETLALGGLGYDKKVEKTQIEF